MGKTAFGVATAAAAAVAGSQVAWAFVAPAAQVTEDATDRAALRGAVAEGPSSRSAPSAAAALAIVGCAGAAAARSAPRRKAAVMRRAAAVAAEEEAPPPPFNPAEQLGATAPLGYFDPLGICKVGDEDTFRSMRSAELKHGRVAMMASVGAVAQAAFQFPGFEKVPKGLGAVTAEPGIYGFVALVLMSGALELTIWKDDPKKGVECIGDFGNPLQLGLGPPMGLSEDMKNREINNGRAAMIAVVGIIAAELATGKDALQQLA